MPLPQATLHGAAGIAVPTLVSTLAISCVFTSVVFLEGPAKYLFTPLGLAVVFAMLASYGLSRTLTPITIGLLLKGEHHGPADAPRLAVRALPRALSSAASSACATAMSRLLRALLDHRFIVPIVVVLVLALGAAMFLLVGRDFFPAIDGGQIQLHVRAPAGTRIETTERIFQAVEDKIREIIPESDRDLIVDNIGLPARAYNLAFTDGSTIGVNDGVILVSLKEGHAPTADYVRKLRAGAAGRISRGHVLFSGGRHRHPDPQFRAAGANRRSDRRLRPGNEPARCQGASAAHRCHSRHRRCASPAGSRCAGVLRRRSTARARHSLGSTPIPSPTISMSA